MSTYPDGVDVVKGAVLSDDGLYRYKLEREWDSGIVPLAFIMLNPSTADADLDDPTIQRCVGFARRLGYGGISVHNLYAWRATKPADLWRTADPVGPDNDAYLRVLFEWAGDLIPVVAAWGANPKPSRVSWVRSMPSAGDCLRHLGLTKDGHPKHPLARGLHRIPDDQPLLPLGAQR